MSDIIFGGVRKIPFLALRVIALLAFFVQPVAAATGDLDTTFGSGGKVTTSFGGNAYGLKPAVQSDGKIVVAGTYLNGDKFDFAVLRYNTDGSLDNTFNGSGKVITDFANGDDIARSVAVQNDGKIVVAGESFTGNWNVARYNANGTLDTTFNGTGQVTWPILYPVGTPAVGAVQSDGKIVVAGTFKGIAVVRFNVNGSLDTDFNGTGSVNTSVARSLGFSVAMQSDGKIVVAGRSWNGANTDFVVVRYNSNGSLDTTFNGTGVVTTDFANSDDTPYSVAVQSDAKIVVAGFSYTGGNQNFEVARYNANGGLDTSFNGTGKVITPMGNDNHYAVDVAVQSDGKIVVVGSFTNANNSDFVVVRYNTNGSLDTSFNGIGKVITPIGNGDDGAYGVAMQNDGKIVVAGYSYNGSNYDFALVRYLGDTPFTLSGTVRDGTGLPVAGASVMLKRSSTVYWQGTSAADGTFQNGAASVGSYTVVATKMGYQTYLLNFDWTGGGNQTLNVTLNALPGPPQTQTTSRVATTNETTPPAPTGNDVPILKVFNGSAFVPGGTVYTDRVTIVLTHGMNSSPSEWALSLASLIRSNNALGSQQPNIVAWDWNFLARGKGPNNLIPPTDNAARQGPVLGQVLLQTLGAGYNQHVHFIGHSLGAIVNAYACDYVHGSLARGGNPANPWNALLTTPHVTLLDEAEIATVFGSNVTSATAIGWKVAQLKGALITGGAAATADWKNTIPKAAKWVDNYISLVGLQRDGAVNVCLLKPTVDFDWLSPFSSLISAHSYAHLYYRNTVSPSGPAPGVGYGKSYESALAFPPSGTGLSAGSVWIENLVTPAALDLVQDTSPIPFESNLVILTALMVQPAAGLANNIIYQPLDAVGRSVLSGYEASILWVGDFGGTVIYKTPQVYAATKEKVGNWWDAAQDTASNVLNSIDPSVLLTGPVTAPVFSIVLSNQSVAPAPSAIGVAAAPPVNQPGYAWLTVNVPANAGMLAFDFTVTGDPVDDSIACAVNGQNVFTLPAKFAPDGSPVSTDMMDISAYAGQSVELFFGLVGGTSTNCQVAIDGIRFITIPQPKVGVAANGPNVLVKWPAAAVGWVLETSTTLAPNSWQPVPLTGVTVASGVATIEQPVSGAKRFYRLRRSP